MAQSYSLTLTGQQILDTSRSEAISSSATQITALEDAESLRRINYINAKWIREPHTKDHGGGWSWMRDGITNIETVTNTTLNGAIAAAASTFILTAVIDSSDSSGRMIIEEGSSGAVDIVDWSSNSSTTYTVSTTSGDQPISMAHLTAGHVEKLYALPSDYGKSIKLLVNSTEYFLSKNEFLFPIGRNYTTIGNFILFPKSIAAQDITLYYEKSETNLTALSQNTDIPIEFERYAVEMALSYIYRIRRKRSDFPTSLELANQALEEALDYDKQQQSSQNSLPLRTGF